MRGLFPFREGLNVQPIGPDAGLISATDMFSPLSNRSPALLLLLSSTRHALHAAGFTVRHITGAPLTSITTLPPSNVKAAAWMAGWLTSMLVLMVAGREITRELDVFQLMEMRSVIGLVMLYPLIRWNGGFASMKTSRPMMHIGRNIVHYCAQYGWFLALTLIPLAQVVAIEFTMPIWTALLAVSFLGERLNAFKILAIVLGLIGVLIIVQPGAAQVSPGQLLMLAGGRRVRRVRRHGQVTDPNRFRRRHHFLDADHPVSHWPIARALCVALAFGACLAVDHRDRVLRHLFALLHDAGDALCGCDRGRADGFPARSAERNGRLAALCRTARSRDHRRRGADPDRKSAQPEKSAHAFGQCQGVTRIS